MAAEFMIRDYLLGALRRHRDRRAIVTEGESWSYRRLEGAAMSLAEQLLRLGVGPGDPVAIVLRNSADYVVADLAIAAVGAAKVPINLMLSDDEVAYILRDSAARVCLIERDRVPATELAARQGAAPETLVRDADDPRWRALFSGPAPQRLPAVDGEHTALLMYTGGTTGLPKGVVHTQRSLAANLLSHLVEMELVADDVLLLTSPLPHSAGFLLQAGLVKGASVFVEDRFDVDLVLDRIEHDRASYLFMVPTMIYRVLDAVAARPGFDSSALRTILYGAAPITVDRLQQGLELFGPVFMQLFAQSEAPNFLTRLRRDDHRIDAHAERLKSCGQSVAMARVRILDERGAACAPGEVGEVTAQAPYVMREYLGRPDETGQALRDGWLHTGDLGYLDDDGYLFLVDRKKDMIISGGLNVYTSEVEQGIAGIDGVGQVAVVGVPHPDWGEAVVAFIVPASPALTVEAVRAEVRGRLTGYKRPKEIVLVDTLPMTAVGKIDKKRLRSEWSAR